eukprot:NODE_10168_length_344_cov_12.054237_g9258_i0.p2 GENE.NODE_10168_length_344_cov_12.054237_g9258_i0~~NODE_10168_length_344_cov_12.054237_g9258_i0.p2  ORF type:complete len:71 (-),score=24.73 NODE_10168_length_344_cov_12.054237_g9258_i0:130-315(-)
MGEMEGIHSHPIEQTLRTFDTRLMERIVQFESMASRIAEGASSRKTVGFTESSAGAVSSPT